MSARREKSKPRNQLNQQLSIQEDQRRLAEEAVSRREANRKLAAKLGDFSFDVAKLVIGGVILAGLMNQDISYLILFVYGFAVVLIFFVFGVMLIRFSNKKDIKPWD